MSSAGWGSLDPATVAAWVAGAGRNLQEPPAPGGAVHSGWHALRFRSSPLN